MSTNSRPVRRFCLQKQGILIKKSDQEKALSEGQHIQYRGVQVTIALDVLVKTGEIQCNQGSFMVYEIRQYPRTCQGNGVSDELQIVKMRKRIRIET